MNIFKVTDIEAIADTNKRYVKVKGQINAVVEIYCNAHGNPQQRLRFQSEGFAYSAGEAIRKAVENLLSHRYNPRQDIYEPKCTCCIELEKMIYDFSELSSPWRELFEQIFSDSVNFPIAKLLVNTSAS